MRIGYGCALLLTSLFAGISVAQESGANKSAQEPTLPYTPRLDLASMDKLADPCVNFYQYACGGWKKNNPIPADETSWEVYGKLYQDNLRFLRGILEQASQNNGQRDLVAREIGDFYAACMDEAGVEKQGLAPLQDDLEAVGKLKSTKELGPLVAQLQLVYGRSALFRASSRQDPDDAQKIIAEVDQGGLGDARVVALDSPRHASCARGQMPTNPVPPQGFKIDG